MALKIKIPYTTGKTLTATLIRNSDGYRWSENAGAWQAAPTYANSKITLTEGSNENLKSYTGTSTGSLGDALRVTVWIHDEGASNSVVMRGEAFIVGGDEVDQITVANILAGTVDTSVSVSKALEMLVAFLAGKVAVVSSGGVSTFTFEKRDGITNSFTCIANEAAPKGTRDTTGSLS